MISVEQFRVGLNQAILGVFIASSSGIAAAQSKVVPAEVPAIKVGDWWKYEVRDQRTGNKELESLRTVTAVSPSRIDGTDNDSVVATTQELNVIESPTSVWSGDVKYFVFPLDVGKKWDFKYTSTNKTTSSKTQWQVDAAVVGYEKIKVPAGEFDTFKIEYKGFWNGAAGRNGRLVVTYWYAPSAKNVVKSESDVGNERNIRELVEFKLQP